MTNKIMTGTLCALSLVGLLSGCSKERMQVFPDRGCLYTGTLTVHRQPQPDWTLQTYRLTDDRTPLAPEAISPLRWRADEVTRVVPIGRHRAVYLPSRLAVTMSAGGRMELPTDPVGGFRTLSPTPLLMGHADGEVRYEEETEVDVIPSDLSTAVRVTLTNSSAEDVSDIDVTVSKGLVGYDCLTGKPTTPATFRMPGGRIDLPSAALQSLRGYLFGVELPMTLHLTFRDHAGAEYTIESEDAFHQDASDKRLYVAELDLSEAGLEDAGVKRTVRAIRIDGRDVTFPSDGGEMTMTVRAYRVTTKYSGGKELSRDEEEISYRYDTTGDEGIHLSYEAPHTFHFTADANDTDAARSRRITVTADGVSRTFTITQPYRSGFTIKGEVQ